MAEIQSWQRQNFAKNASTGPSKMNSKIAGNSTSFHSKIAKPTAYADGGEVKDEGEFAGVDDAVRANKVVYEDDVAPRVATDDEMRAQAPANDDAASEVKVDATGGKQSFKQAFAENRKAGNSTFEWNGKKFNTEIATGKQAPRMEAKRAEASTSAPATGGGKSIMFKDKPAPAEPKSTSFDPNAINFGDTKVAPKPAERKYRQTRGGRIYEDELPEKAAPAPKVHARTGRPL